MVLRLTFYEQKAILEGSFFIILPPLSNKLINRSFTGEYTQEL